MKVINDIVNAYVEAASGDLREALRRAVGDALADLLELERRTRCTESGWAVPSDTFVYTGVPRSPGFIGGEFEE